MTVTRTVLALVVLGAAFFSCRGEGARRPNVVLISVDTLRADHLGAYGYPRQTSPFLDALAARGRLFEEVLVPLPTTDPSHASLLTGRHPFQHGVLANAMDLPGDSETLGEAFRKGGYVTAGVVAVEHLARRYGFDRGFSEFADAWDQGAELDNAHARTAPSVNADVFRILQRVATRAERPPLFLFVHYFDVHKPYIRREGFLPAGEIPEERLGTEARRYTRRNIEGYDSEIAYVDHHIEEVRSRLDELGFGKNLVFCVTADHGEQLGDHGYHAGHADIYRETVRVPLVCEGPGVGRGRVAETVSSMDIPTSLLALAGLRFQNPVEGRNLFAGAPEAGRAHLVMGYPSFTRSLAVVQGGFWFIRNLDHIFKTLYVGPASKAEDADHREAPLRGEAGRTAFVLAVPLSSGRVRPAWVSARVAPRPGCTLEAELVLEPRVAYLPRPALLRQPTLLHFPVTGGEVTTLSASPSSCLESVGYRFLDAEDFSRPGPAHRGLTTDLWKELKTRRKFAPGDELYDVPRDPRQLENLVGDPAHAETARALDALVDTLFGRYHRSRVARTTRELSPADVEMLRSLGYLD